MDAAVSIELFVEILNQYVYYYDQENEAVSPTFPEFAALHLATSLSWCFELKTKHTLI